MKPELMLLDHRSEANAELSNEILIVDDNYFNIMALNNLLKQNFNF